MRTGDVTIDRKNSGAREYEHFYTFIIFFFYVLIYIFSLFSSLFTVDDEG